MKIIRYLFLALFLGLALIYGAVHIPPVKKYIIAQGLALFVQQTGQHLEAADIEFELPFVIKITHPHLKEVFEASKLHVRLNPYSFFCGEIHIHSLMIADLKLEEGDEPLTLQDMLSFLPPYAVTVNDLQLIRFQGSDIEAKVVYDPQEGYAYIAGKAASGENHLEASLALVGDEAMSSLSFDITTTQGILPGRLADFRGTLSASFFGSCDDWDEFIKDPHAISNYQLHGQLRASGIAPYAGSLSASALLGEGYKVRLTDLELKTPLFRLESTLCLGPDNRLDGTGGCVHINNIADLLPEVAGPAAFNFQLQGTQEDLRGDIDLFPNKIDAYGTWIEGGAKIEFSYNDKLEAHLASKKLGLESFELENIDLAMQDSAFQLNFKYRENPFFVKGNFDSQVLHIAHLTGKWESEPLLLNAPFSLSLDPIATTPVDLSWGKGSILAKAEMKDDDWDLILSFEGIPSPLEGELEGKAHFFGKKEALQGDLQLQIHEIIPHLSGSCQAHFANRQMECQGELSGIGSTPLQFQGTFPVAVSLSGIVLDKDLPIKANFHAEGPLTPLLELFTIDSSSMSANGKIQMQVGGTLSDPQFSGAFSLRDGIFENYELGTIITDIEADLQGKGNRLELTRLTGSDGAQGVISGSGRVVLSKKEGFPFRWDIVLQNAKPIQVDMLKGTASGQLSWHGTVDKSVIEGDLAIVRGELILPKKLPETSVSYPVRYINNETNVRKPTEIIAEGGREIPIELKIQVAANDLSITDEDLKSSWNGKVSLQGTVEKPAATGEIKLQSGDYILNGQRFVLSQGRVSFNGDFEKRSNLYVSLSREIGDYEVEIVLKGLLKDPEILLQSHPALPKAQVLSLILFGQTSADISALQEEQLEQSLSNLTTSSSKKEGTLDKIQKTLGIDHIDFMRSGEAASDVRIRLSKYISRGICLSVYRDVTEEVNAVSLEAELLKNIKAQVEAQDNAEGQVSIFWKKNY